MKKKKNWRNVDDVPRSNCFCVRLKREGIGTFITLARPHKVMGANKTGARIVERVWAHLREVGPMNGQEIAKWYANEYENGALIGQAGGSSFTQTLQKSNCFRRIAWVDRRNETTYPNMPYAEIRNKGWRAYATPLFEAREIQEILEPYLNGMSTFRRIEKMPPFVRKAYRGANA
tara:strand:- start:8260 stop:8784 length:525 start_codon:yes stop_codon:yes gene_type:complete